MTTPPGWTIEGTWPDGWEVGSTRNTRAGVPASFHSGNNGAAINLTTKYTNNVYTHLISEEYTLPTTQRGVSRSVLGCARNSTGTGAVSVFRPTGGSMVVASPTTQRLPRPNLNREHQLTVFGEGIIDGSKRSQRMRRIHAPWLRVEDLRPFQPFRSIDQTALLLFLRHLR